MLISFIGYSLIPVAIVLFQGQDSPFTFVMGWRGGVALVYAVFLVAAFHKLIFNRQIWQSVWHRKSGRHAGYILLATIGYLDIALLAMSLNYIGVVLATVLSQITPAVLIIITWLTHRELSADSDGKGSKGNLSLVIYLMVGFSGVVFVAVSQVASESFLEEILASNLREFIPGILLAVGAAVIGGFNSGTLRWGERLRDRHLSRVAPAEPAEGEAPGLAAVSGEAEESPEAAAVDEAGAAEVSVESGDVVETPTPPESDAEAQQIEWFGTTLAALIASIAVIPLCWAISSSGVTDRLDDALGKGEYRDETAAGLDFNTLDFGAVVDDLGNVGNSFSDQSALVKLVLILVAGALINGVAGLLWRRANAISDSPYLNSLDSLRPLFSLLWLWLLPLVLPLSALLYAYFSHVEPSYFSDVGLPYLVIGTAAIVTANVLINFRAEMRGGFNALIIGLGTFGAIVYLRDEVYAGLGIDGWKSNDYLGAVALAATIFTLLLAFRVATVVSRTSDEETHTFNALRKLRSLAQRGLIDPDVLECVIQMDSPKDQEKLKGAYERARYHISNVPDLTDSFDRELLVDAESSIDDLARSKQLGLVLGELFSLNVFAAITIAFSILVRPDVEGNLLAMLYDIFAMLISAVILFFTVHVWDLHRERSKEQLRFNEGSKDYLVQFLHLGQTTTDQWFSIVAGIAIVLTYVVLLAQKWLGWFI